MWHVGEEGQRTPLAFPPTTLTNDLFPLLTSYPQCLILAYWIRAPRLGHGRESAM